jgi:hypothetical protein
LCDLLIDMTIRVLILADALVTNADDARSSAFMSSCVGAIDAFTVCTVQLFEFSFPAYVTGIQQCLGERIMLAGDDARE